MAKYKTKSDLVTNKKVFLNGEQLSGVQAVSLNYDIEKLVTIVELKMVVQRGSVTITDDEISFNEVNYND